MAENKQDAGELIPAKEAARKAVAYLKDLVGQIYNPQIEEIELADDGSIWHITISFTPPNGFQTDYKVFRIGAKTGEVLSMKMREI